MLLAQYHGIAADAGQLAHEYCRKSDSFDETTLLLAARKLGLKANVSQIAFARLPMASLPAMGWGRDGNALKAWLWACTRKPPNEKIMFRTAWFYVAMLPLVIALGLVNKYASLEPSMLMAGCGLCAAISARVTDTSLLEWKMLTMMLVTSLVGMLLFQSWQNGKLFCEFLFWWGVFGIPLRATMRPINERKR